MIGLTRAGNLVTIIADSWTGQKGPREHVITPSELGFEQVSLPGAKSLAWTRTLRGQRVVFRTLRSMESLIMAEQMQREVLGLSELDTMAASALIAVSETGGEVLGAFVETDQGEAPAGVSVGYGGFHHHQPRLLSEFLAVYPQFRSLGLGTELKRLQAGLASERGFPEITWTVDPLRAPNARLNFEKLGGYSRHYEIDRYRSTFGAEFYGGMPTDRLHITWPIASQRVQRLLLDNNATPAHEMTTAMPNYSVLHWSGGSALVPVPSDIDALVLADPGEALRWRMNTRNLLISAFSQGLAVTGFVEATRLGTDNPALLLEPCDQAAGEDGRR